MSFTDEINKLKADHPGQVDLIKSVIKLILKEVETSVSNLEKRIQRRKAREAALAAEQEVN